VSSPERYFNVRLGQLSLAVKAGRARINGEVYEYDPETDSLIRQDIFNAIRHAEREAARQEDQRVREAFEAAQMSLF
jgi:hypothetical protein